MSSRKPSKSLIFASEQRIIREKLNQLYDCAGDQVFRSLYSVKELEAMQSRTLSIISSHNYMSLNNEYVEAAYDGICEKLKINGRHSDSALLVSLWDELQSIEFKKKSSNISITTVSSELSVTHSMIKLFLQLSCSPSQEGKQSGVSEMIINDTKTLNSIAELSDTQNEFLEDNNDLEYWQIEEDRKLWIETFDEDSDDEEDQPDERYSSGSVSDNKATSETRNDSTQRNVGRDETLHFPDNNDNNSERYLFGSSSLLTDPLFDAGQGGLSYGGHISLYSSSSVLREGSRASVPLRDVNPQEYSTHSHYSTSLVPNLPPPDIHDSDIIYREADVLIMITEMFLGNSNDFFFLSKSKNLKENLSNKLLLHPLSTVDHGTYSMTNTAQHARLVHMTGALLRNLLSFFIDMANLVQIVRNYAFVDFAFLRRGLEEKDVISYKEGSSGTIRPSLFSEKIQSALQIGLRELLEKFEEEISYLQSFILKTSHVSSSSLHDNKISEQESITLIRVYVAVHKFKNIFSSAATLTNNIVKLDLTSVSEHLNDQKEVSQDLIHHEKFLAIFSQLQHEADVLHMLHCHGQLSIWRSTPSHSLTHDSAIKSQSSNLNMECCIIKPSLELNFFRNSFFALQGAYLNLLLDWLHATSSDKKSKRFGGVSVESRVSALTPSSASPPAGSEQVSTFLSPDNSPEQNSVTDIFMHSRNLRDVVRQAYSCVSDIKILRKYHQFKNKGRDSSRNSFDTRDFLSSVNKCMHASLVMYEIRSESSERLFISSKLQERRRSECLQVEEQVEVLGAGSGSVRGSAGLVGGDGDWTDGDSGDGNEMEGELRKESYKLDGVYFYSHEGVMYESDVLKGNVMCLRQYFQSRNSGVTRPLSPPRCGDEGQRGHREEDDHMFVPFLADLFPSCSLLARLIATESLNNMLSVTQSTAVNLVLQRFYLNQHFKFLQSVFLLGECNHVFASLREHILSSSNASRVRQYSSYSSRRYQETILRSISSSIMLRITNFLPPNFLESYVTVAFLSQDVSNGDDDKKDNYSEKKSQNSLSSSDSERFFDALCTLTLQMHYPSPLSEIITPMAIFTYNSHMQYLLKILLCCWNSEKLWKKSTSSKSCLTKLCSRSLFRHQLRNNKQQDTLSIMCMVYRECMSGLQWIIHVCRTLESFYLNEIHNILWDKFNKVCKQSQSSVSAADVKWRGLSITSVTQTHEIYLNSITKCLLFLQSIILRIIKESVIALGLFDEAHEAADANVELLFPSAASSTATHQNDSLDEMSMKIILSRLNHTANRMSKFQVLKNELLITLEKLYRSQDLPKDDQVYASALRSLISNDNFSKFD